ncbi:hypothetical protein DVH24_008822 [Malus domestica]|uniref:Uncharacterized protein n=1 Tax=Malus domestica TaxID=3750 RepID=A0A498JKQ9_MALDO|nr:hypothetical protein DVH24_008822 [Malus domestica]
MLSANSLPDEAMDHVIGYKTSQEAWDCQERFAYVYVIRVNQLEFHTITENDYIIAALSDLSPEFEVIKTIILAKDIPISLKDFRAQLLGTERYIESRVTNLSYSISAMCVQNEI